MNIGWIGLGNMGVPMVRNAAKAGFNVRAYNRTERTFDLGPATRAASIRDAVTAADVVGIMVSDAAAVEAVVFDADGVCAHARPGTLVVNFSTIGVDETRALALRAADAGLEWLDAPVSGSVGPANDAKLVVLAGGSEAAFERVRPWLLTMSKQAFHLGPVGSGAAMKLLVNAYLGAVVATASECMAVAEKAGLGQNRWLEVIRETAMWSPILAGKQALWEARDYPQAFALKHMNKDLALMSRYASTLSAAVPALTAVWQAYLEGVASDWAEHDMSAVLEVALRHAGVTP
ncbi:MAG: NAD(P)-dependent oxidoreductase [Alicyclobacillus sp.]|nr:NAD(P)-dependent oxidoreductase [Alicyclobacillus sp.]